MTKVADRLFRFRGLLATLVSRELKARYRGSVLGFFWSLVTPLLLLGVYTFVFSVVFQPRFKDTDPYVLFLMTGLFPWTWVATSLMEGTQSLTANSGLIRKAVFPAEVLPMVSVLSNLVHFVLAIPILVAGLIIGRVLGFSIGGWTVVLFPVVVALQLPALGGLILGLSALNVHFKDVKDIVGNLLALLFYLTPIIYPLGFLEGYAPLRWAIEWLNPFTPYARAYQAVLFQGALPSAQIWIQMVGWGAVLWLAGCWLFGRLSDSLVEAV